MKSPSYFSNKYNAKCCKCGIKVISYDGVCFSTDQGWQVGCRSCFPSECAALYATRDAAITAHQKEQDALEARRIQLVADRKALIEKLGIDFSQPFDIETKQLSYSDNHTFKVAFTGEGSDEEFRNAVATPSESLFGQLRASNGRSLASIDRGAKTLSIFESVSICD